MRSIWLKDIVASGYSPPSASAVAGREVQSARLGLQGGGWPWEITHSHWDRGTEECSATHPSGQMSYWAPCVSRHLFFKLFSCLLYSGMYLQYFRIIGSSAFLHSICWVSYFIKNTLREKGKKKKSPHPSSEGPWFIFPVTNINFMAHFCLLEKKNVAYMNLSSILFIVLRPDLLMIKM